jgi:hypothetical protein
MEYKIISITNGFEENENEVIDVTGLSAEDFSLIIQLPYNHRMGTRIDGTTLLVTVAKPGLLGWLQRKIIGW